MKKKFQIDNLDCAHCAAKMEEAISKIQGIDEVSVSFLTQKITIVSDESVFDTIMPELERICKKVDKNIKLHY